MKLRHYRWLLSAAYRVELQRLLGRPTLPYKLEFITTFACGSRCRTCNIWKRYIDEPEKQAEEMSIEEILRAVRSSRSQRIVLESGTR